MESAWYKNAIFYSLDVETFYDSNNDGIGDFQGLIQKLDYVASLGATCIWLLPFYTSPNHDNGYDVRDYYNVDQRLGTLGDFSAFMDKANVYGIKVIIDLVVNHTSREHRWFKEARKNKESKYYRYYVWSDKPQSYQREKLMLKGEEDTIWTYDKVAKQYYLHRFYKEQPDLNISNKDVQDEILKIIGFWLRLGVSGFRLDAAELFIEPYGMKNAQKKELAAFMGKMRTFLSSKKGDAILLAEVNAKPKKLKTFLHDEGRMHMIFNFYINQHLFLALAKEDATPLIKALKEMPPLDPENQWLNFLRHHDELSLSLLKAGEKSIVLKKFAPKMNMRIFKQGIRRRLAPMVNNSRQMLELYNSLLFSLPGIPLIRYGDEIGMGDDLSLPGRESVRTPMQWTEYRNGGFSEARKNKLMYNVIDEGIYGHKNLNALQAQRDPQSFLNWIERLIVARKQSPAIGLGEFKIIQTPYKNLFAHTFEWKNEKMLFLHNLSQDQIIINKKKLSIAESSFLDVFGSEEVTQYKDSFVINGYGFQWYKAQAKII